MGHIKISASTALALAAVVLSSSTAAFVVAKVPAHSVGAKQLKTSAVTNSKLAKSAVSNSKLGKSAVSNSKLAKNAVTASKVKANSLGGTQIKESSLGLVPNAGFASLAGNTTRLEGKGAANFVGATRLAFGTGFANSTAAATVLSLPNVGVTVTTDGDTDTDPEVVVNLPSTAPAFAWVVNSTWESQTFSSMGGAVTLSAQEPVVPSGATATSREFTAHIWRSDTTAAIYLHCAFDTDNFTTARPLSCWAFST
jgi:hypothetical protein